MYVLTKQDKQASNPKHPEAHKKRPLPSQLIHEERHQEHKQPRRHDEPQRVVADDRPLARKVEDVVYAQNF